MDFGLLTFYELNEVDFTLPADGSHTNKTFAKLHDIGNTRFHLGCPKWNYDDWKGVLYTNKASSYYKLPEYVKNFNSVELNSTFYSIPPSDLIKTWAEMADSPDFLFLPKLSRIFTHVKRLVDTEQAMESYLSAISNFGSLLGPIFMQLGDNFGPNNFLIIERFLRGLPADKRFFVELRQPDWFSNAIARRQIFSLLSELKIGAIITDTAGRRDVLHMELSIPEVFIRFVGNGGKRIDEDKARIDAWIQRISNWKARGLEKVYFFIHQREVSSLINDNGPAISVASSEGLLTLSLADYAIKQFNQDLDAHLPELKLL